MVNCYTVLEDISEGISTIAGNIILAGKLAIPLENSNLPEIKNRRIYEVFINSEKRFEKPRYEMKRGERAGCFVLLRNKGGINFNDCRPIGHVELEGKIHESLLQMFPNGNVEFTAEDGKPKVLLNNMGEPMLLDRIPDSNPKPKEFHKDVPKESKPEETSEIPKELQADGTEGTHTISESIPEVAKSVVDIVENAAAAQNFTETKTPEPSEVPSNGNGKHGKGSRAKTALLDPENGIN